MMPRILNVLLICLFVSLTHQNSENINPINQTFLIPCQKYRNDFEFPSHGESHLWIYTDPNIKEKGVPMSKCDALLLVPDGKFLSLRISPFEPIPSCNEIGVWLGICPGNNRKSDLQYVQPCDSHTTYHSYNNQVMIEVYIGQLKPPFSVTIVVSALDKNARRRLHVSNHKTLSGSVTPYGFDGFHDHPLDLYASTQIDLPPGYSVMFSFPHFHVKPTPGCRWSFLQLYNKKTKHRYWRHCGSLQLPPKLHTYYPSLWFGFRTRTDRGFTGFKVRFSFHPEAELPEILPTSAVFNCSVSFFATFSQHLMCNLEMECAHGEDEVSCPYWQGDCQSDFLNAGGKCYKYVKTRMRMTWYDASSLCSKEGLTLSSFPTFKEGQAFRDGILRYAPSIFNVFIGLRTSDASLAAIYREVWQWASGIMAYYVHIGRQQLFKPTCASFAALSRHKLTTTMCGFYEYMHYIFCEMETPSVLEQSNRINLIPIEVKSTFSLVNITLFVTCSEGHVVHDFLSCDHESRCSAEHGVKSCVTYSSDSAAKSMEVLMYVCDSQTQTIHYTQVCDHQTQCFDSSDESFCIYQVCSEKQCQNHQCVTAAQWCDGMAHCSDGSDEACPRFITVSAKPPSSPTGGSHVVLFDGYGKYKYVSQGKEFSFCPLTHFMCANLELCLPIYLRCNGVYDCADREDENSCENAKCLGFYRCRQSVVCVHSDHVCDGMFQCPQQDDELLCQLVCPDNCLCQGLAFVCPRPFPAHLYSDLRYLDSSGSKLFLNQLYRNHYLVRLVLLRCGLYTLPVFEFPNLKFLYLDYNTLTHVKMKVFTKLSNLNVLSLSGNPITLLLGSESNVFLKKVHSLDLSHTKLGYFESKVLWNICNLKKLNISYGMLKIISNNGFRFLTRIESLDLRGSKLKEYPIKMLKSLPSLRIMFSDIYKLCCQDVLPEQFNIHNCYTSPDEIASCKDLLRSDIYKMLLWVFCCFALVGNIGSFVANIHIQIGKPLTSFNVFISNLNVADFLMGLYLAMIGSADQVYKGAYLWHDNMWKASVCCKTAGFFSLLSCEMSAFIICLVTLDRVLIINFPFSQVRFRKMSAQVVCTFSWMVGVTLAVLPLLPVTSHWEFYSQTDICIPLPITKQDFKGHFYSFGILIVLNFLLFVFIAVGQIVIYISIRVNSMETEQKTEREFTVARRLLTVVISDFLCWFPIGLFGLLASSDVSIPGEVNVAIAIFALPLNSALNPFLYTFNLLMEKRQKASEKRILKRLQVKYSGGVSTNES